MKPDSPSPFLNRDLRWVPERRVRLPQPLRSWVRDTGSLTRRLQRLGHFQVRPLRQRIGAPRAEEARLLGMRSRRHVLIREVLLHLDGDPVVHARSVIPVTSLGGANRVLGHMARRSLGAELFRRPAAERHQVWVALVPGVLVPGGDSAWGRQSLFLKRGRPLLVAEVFLPGLWQHPALEAAAPH